jgi:enoyl-CoA hydratase/carnithine racemase
MVGTLRFAHPTKTTKNMKKGIHMAKDYADMRAAILRDLDGLRYEVDADKKIGRLILDRPPLNVVSYRGRSQISAIIEAFGQDPEVRVVVIRGANGTYTSGGDVKAFPAIETDGMSHLAWNIAAPERCPKPVICAIEKYAMGVGLELAMACDIRIASEEAKFGQPEVNLGMMPGGGATQRLPRLVGLGNALAIMYTGQILDSTEALRVGLVDVVVPARQLEERTMTLAKVIATKSPMALAMIKEATRASQRAPLDQGVRREQSLASVIFSSKDMQEGVRAFLEKRQPRFTGE